MPGKKVFVGYRIKGLLGGALLKEGVPAALERVEQIINQREPETLAWSAVVSV